MNTSKIIKGVVNNGRYTVTAPDSADMIADANITSGQYFIIFGCVASMDKSKKP